MMFGLIPSPWVILGVGLAIGAAGLAGEIHGRISAQAECKAAELRREVAVRDAAIAQRDAALRALEAERQAEQQRADAAAERERATAAQAADDHAKVEEYERQLATPPAPADGPANVVPAPGDDCRLSPRDVDFLYGLFHGSAGRPGTGAARPAKR